MNIKSYAGGVKLWYDEDIVALEDSGHGGGVGSSSSVLSTGVNGSLNKGYNSMNALNRNSYSSNDLSHYSYHQQLRSQSQVDVVSGTDPSNDHNNNTGDEENFSYLSSKSFPASSHNSRSSNSTSSFDALMEKDKDTSQTHPHHLSPNLSPHRSLYQSQSQSQAGTTAPSHQRQDYNKNTNNNSNSNIHSRFLPNHDSNKNSNLGPDAGQGLGDDYYHDDIDASAGMGVGMAGGEIGPEKQGTVPQYVHPSMADEVLEVVAVNGPFHLGQLQIGLSRAIKIGQFKSLEITTLKKVPIQLDGEPEIIEANTTCSIKVKPTDPKGAIMLKRTTDSGGAVATEMADLLDWAVETNQISKTVKTNLLNEFAKRVEQTNDGKYKYHDHHHHRSNHNFRRRTIQASAHDFNPLTYDDNNNNGGNGNGNNNGNSGAGYEGAPMFMPSEVGPSTQDSGCRLM